MTEHGNRSLKQKLKVGAIAIAAIGVVAATWLTNIANLLWASLIVPSVGFVVTLAGCRAGIELPLWLWAITYALLMLMFALAIVTPTLIEELGLMARAQAELSATPVTPVTPATPPNPVDPIKPKRTLPRWARWVDMWSETLGFHLSWKWRLDGKVPHPTEVRADCKKCGHRMEVDPWTTPVVMACGCGNRVELSVPALKDDDLAPEFGPMIIKLAKEGKYPFVKEDDARGCRYPKLRSERDMPN